MLFFDWTYLIVLPALIFSVWASVRVNTTFNKNSKIFSKKGYTAAMACRAVLDNKGLYSVSIEHVPGNLTDHYDPRANVIRLSDSVYNSTSAAAIGVACHEAGHAIQYAENYAPVKLRQAIIPITNIGSNLGIWIFILGIFLTMISQTFVIVAYIGIGLFSFTALFQLITLPTEYNASSRAIASIERTGILDSEEIKAAKAVLSAAALTYVAALAASLSQLLRLLLILGRFNRND